MKLFPKWKTVNRIIDPTLTAEIGTWFNSYDTPAVILVQEKDKVFSDGTWYRCLVKTVTLTDAVDCDIIMATLGIDTYDKLKEFKP